jgi:hypothetical protein
MLMREWTAYKEGHAAAKNTKKVECLLYYPQFRAYCALHVLVPTMFLL